MPSEPFFAPVKSSLDYSVHAPLGLFTEMIPASQKHTLELKGRAHEQ